MAFKPDVQLAPEPEPCAVTIGGEPGAPLEVTIVGTVTVELSAEQWQALCDKFDEIGRPVFSGDFMFTPYCTPKCDANGLPILGGGQPVFVCTLVDSETGEKTFVNHLLGADGNYAPYSGPVELCSDDPVRSTCVQLVEMASMEEGATPVRVAFTGNVEYTLDKFGQITPGQWFDPCGFPIQPPAAYTAENVVMVGCAPIDNLPPGEPGTRPVSCPAAVVQDPDGSATIPADTYEWISITAEVDGDCEGEQPPVEVTITKPEGVEVLTLIPGSKPVEFGTEKSCCTYPLQIDVGPGVVQVQATACVQVPCPVEEETP